MSFGGESYEQTADNISSSHLLLVESTSHARTRCVSLSGGVLVEPLVTSLSEYYTEYTQRLFSLLRRLRRIAGLDLTNSIAGSPTTAVGKGPAASPSSSAAAAESKDARDSALAQSSSTSWSNFQGCFLLLSVCRSLQRDVFSREADRAIIQNTCGNQSLLITIIKSAQMEQDREKNNSNENTSSTTEQDIPFTPSSSKSMTPSSTRVQSVSSMSSSSFVFHNPSELARALGICFLVRRPERLKSLTTFVTIHYLPLHPGAFANTSNPQGLNHTHGAAASGLIHHPTTPGASPLATSKYGFPTPSTPGGASTPSGAMVSSSSNASSSSSSSAVASSVLFSSSAQLFDSFISALHNLIYDVMLRPVTLLLAPWPEWTHIWSSKTATGLLSSIALPSFTLQPSEYIITIGEHLLTVVQQLEPYVKKQEEDEDEDDENQNNENEEAKRIEDERAQAMALDNNNEQTPVALMTPKPSPTTNSTSKDTSSSSPSYLEHDALYWLNLLSKGTFKSLLSCLYQLTALSDRGARQLHTDFEYLSNVLTALGLAIPSTIAKLDSWLQANEQQMMDAAKMSAANSNSNNAMNTPNEGVLELRLDELNAEQKKLLKHLIVCRKWNKMAADTWIQARINN